MTVMKYWGNEPEEDYDLSNEPPIPREFFFEDEFDYQTANIPELLDNFLQNIGYVTYEGFFYTPEQMLENGFKGIPYRYLLDKK